MPFFAPAPAPERPASSGGAVLDAAFDDLENDLVGLADAKRHLRAIVQRRQVRGAAADAPMHMCFTGNAGTGKSCFAQKTADLLCRLGWIEHNRVLMATGAEFSGLHPGQSGQRARDALKRAAGGVLFIDDPHTLNRPESEHDFGREAIDVLIDAMRSDQSGVVVILSGERGRMRDLFDHAPRLRAAIAHDFHFEDYNQQELLAIAERMLDGMQCRLDAEARASFAAYLANRIRQPHFANARSVRNALDRARMRQASRLFAQSLAGQSLDPAAMRRIEDTDLAAACLLPAASSGPALHP